MTLASLTMVVDSSSFQVKDCVSKEHIVWRFLAIGRARPDAAYCRQRVPSRQNVTIVIHLHMHHAGVPPVANDSAISEETVPNKRGVELFRKPIRNWYL